MIRILHSLEGMSKGGGIQSFIMSVYRNIDRSQIQFDFLLHRKDGETYDEEISKLGGLIFYTPPRRDGIKKYERELNAFFKNNSKNYKIIHFHESNLSDISALKYAKKFQIPVRIIHSHSANVGKRNRYIHLTLHKFNKLFVPYYATDFFSGGQFAKEWMFGGTKAEKLSIDFPYAVDINNFIFSNKKRNEIRNSFNLEDKFTLLQVGRMEPVKNHKFTLEVFKKIIEKNNNSLLLLLGDGSLRKELENIVKNDNSLNGNVLFLGVRDDVDKFYCAADSMIFPSLYEGFGNVGVEAQASGLPVIMSDRIPKAAVINNNSKQLSLECTHNEWADFILSNTSREPDISKVLSSGFDIKDVAKNLTSIYLKMYGKV